MSAFARMLDLKSPHRRYNPLTGEWVLVSPQRTSRPWRGQHEEIRSEIQPAYDPDCYLCPGNERAGGARNPGYLGTFVFENDFAALQQTTPPDKLDENGLIVAEGETGICRVVCFSPRHDLTMARMGVSDIRGIVDTWVAQYLELGQLPFINWVQIFENRGAMMGASNPHPHGQIWANSNLPNEAHKENTSQLRYLANRRTCLLCDYLNLELGAGERLVLSNQSFHVIVPFWAVWPFETMVIGKRHAAGLDELTMAERNDLADILKRLATLYDDLFQTLFPYTMGFHQRPTNGATHPEWHLHSHFYPPLLRSAAIRKFMVGYELLSGPQRDLTPEEAALRLSDLLKKT